MSFVPICVAIEPPGGKVCAQLTPPSVDMSGPPAPYPLDAYSLFGLNGSSASDQIRPLSSKLPPGPVLIFTQLLPRSLDLNRPCSSSPDTQSLASWGR